MGDLIDLAELRKAESDNLTDAVGMTIVDFLAGCKIIKHRDVPELLRKLADTWLGNKLTSEELPF
jgi:hypothetical protein